ncbi:probable LRR receptor-like serine/threonine-protein kinase At1g67720 [Physcomitrium patens]|uniref:probable LRR receptor-like serine/threonine-protein kinase At1g67720 n=1 Tax=Physcomitrium patens TaxID=3218 RepID=UPI000D158EE2|nr:probable LRR receptor-like serine/threonine-protein kinase At1g67720 [Physcomitrium patens]|eukprot:XP_024374635.1 probable LRR receptor-like serine/threonine-protein kinase At1g67720 [Physcomitrella patens]
MSQFDDQAQQAEVIYRTKVSATTISYCLFKDPTSKGTPFISSLVFRQVPDRSFTFPRTLEGNFMILWQRRNYGGSVWIRYPDDVLDRLWAPWVEPSPLTTISTLTPVFILGAFRSSVWGYSQFSITSNSVVTMTPAPGSINPPLLNALEIYLNRPDAVAGTNELDVAALEKIKVALNLTGWGGDPCLPVPLSWVLCSPVTATAAARVISVRLSRYNLTGIIPVEFAELAALQTLWLDNNKLVGNTPNLQKLQQLKSLHLNDNGLSGSIPDSLSFIPTLEELFLQNNNLTGTVPDALKNKSGLNLNINGNPVCGPTCSNPGPGRKSNVGLTAGVVGGVVGVLVVGGILLFRFCRKRQTTKGMEQELPKSNSDPYKSGGKGKGKGKGGVSNFLVPDLNGTNGQGAKPFSHAEITAATLNFSKQIGAGGFGPVYYGKLANGREVAVKVSDMSSRQGAAEFNNEVQLLSRVHHRNLVSLLGYCQEDGKQMLVYEYLHKGTVREHLWGSPLATKEPLDWKQRLDVSLNAAQGLEYLHTGCSPIIIHRDIKSSNILLTDKYVAKVADFGLSRLGPEESSGATHVSTVVKGTAGYLDPEFWSTNHLSERSDVFSFGVVLLEVLCGRQPINNGLPDKSQSNIVEWVRNSLLAGDIESILDPAVRDCHPNMDSVWKVAELAIQCVEPRGIHRPWMRDVVKELREAIVLEDGDSGAFSEMDRSNNTGTSIIPAAFKRGNSDDHYFVMDSSSNLEQINVGPQVR